MTPPMDARLVVAHPASPAAGAPLPPELGAWVPWPAAGGACVVIVPAAVARVERVVERVLLPDHGGEGGAPSARVIAALAIVGVYGGRLAPVLDAYVAAGTGAARAVAREVLGVCPVFKRVPPPARAYERARAVRAHYG